MNPRLSIIVACRNERAHVEALCDAIANQDLDGISWEAVFADGCSDDGTRQLLRDFCNSRSAFHLVENPEQIVSTGLNRAIAAANGDLIIRMDAHTHYERDYCRRCIEALEQSGADNAGGPARTRANGRLPRAIAAAYHSPFSTGGGKFHDESYEGWVDTVPYGCWRRSTLEALGLFDEDLVRNQDDELNLRLIRAGGRIWQSPGIVSWYTPRAGLAALFQQYLQYGFWKVAVIRKHRLPGSWRHLVPVLFVLANLLLPLVTAIAAVAGYTDWALRLLLVWLAISAAYLVAMLAASLAAARKSGWDLLPYLPVVFAAYHISYGLGFLAGLLSKRPAAGQPHTATHLFTRLSR